MDSLGLIRAVLSEMRSAVSLDELLTRTTALLHRLLGNESTGILQLNADHTLLTCRALNVEHPSDAVAMQLPVEFGLIAAAARSQTTIVSGDVASDPRYLPIPGWTTRSELCVPLTIRDGLWGVLDLQSAAFGAFGVELVQAIEIIAAQLALAIDHLLLAERASDQALQLDRRARELSQVLALNSQLRFAVDLETLLQDMADTICRVLGYKVAVVNLVDVAANRAWVAAMSGLTDEERATLRGASYRWDTFIGPTPERYVVSNSYFIPAEAGVAIEGISISRDIDGRGDNAWRAEDVLLVPIVNHRGEMLGMISLDDPLDGLRPSVATIQGLEVFAGQMASAIENQRLFAQTQAALESARDAHDEQVRLLDEVRRAQAELITASKLAAVGTLAAGVAHEFNNLLTSIHGFAELGLIDPEEEREESLRVIRRTAKRGMQITRRLLTFARQEEGLREPARVNDIAEAALQLVNWELARVGVTVERDYRTQAWVLVDPSQIMQVLLNLLTNARDAMLEKGGTLTLATFEEDGMVAIAVADTGDGIDDSVRERLFEPFVTTKGALGGGALGGTGLGLSVSYGIVQAHSGTLSAESARGQGSRFTVRLPASVELRSTLGAPPPAVPRGESLRVLVAGSETRRLALAGSLTGAGHVVAQVADDGQLFEMLAREPWDALVVDCAQPSENLAIVQQLRQRGITLPALMIGDAPDPLPEGAAVLATPFDIVILSRALAATAGLA